MANNPKYFGQSTTGTPNQIEDGVDFPHTGLLKALSTASSGRYAVSGFDISGETTTEITVAAGKIMYNNFLLDVNGATLTLSSSHSNGYHLLVAPKPTGFAPNYASPTVVLRNPSAADKVAEYDLGDTIIGVVTHTGTTNAKVQFLTYDKTENSLSLAHNNASATYTEMGKVYATSTGIVIEQDSATNLGNIQIKNTDQDRDIVFTLDDGGVEKSITLNADIATAQFGDFSITTNGSVVANGVTLTGGGTVSNHGDNRIITSGVANTDLNGEANLTFDDSTNVLAVAGSITCSDITATNNIAATLGSVSAGMNVNAPSVFSGTGTLGSLGTRTKGFSLVADATNGGYSTIHAFADFNTIMGNLGANVLAPTKEVYYIGYDSQGLNNASHAGGTVINPTSAGAGTEFEKLTKATNVIQAGTVGSHSYAAEDIFGGHALFFAINTPAANIGQSVTLHNITSFAMYIVVIDKDADPSQAILRNRVNGGFRAQNHYFDQEGNEKCVDMSEVMLRSVAYPNSANSYTRDAILLKPRESITLQSIRITAAELGSQHDVDVYWQQGLYATQNGGEDISQWFITSSISNNSNANIVRLDGANRHIPVHLTGTAFVCTGTNNILLPNRPPVGTQYSFLVKDGTTNINVPDFATQIDMFTSKGLAVGVNDALYELSASPTTLPLAIAGGNAKTFIYTVQRNWEVIG